MEGYVEHILFYHVTLPLSAVLKLRDSGIEGFRVFRVSSSFMKDVPKT
jgi:hypothetical protein